MSNYTQTTNFTAKDALITGDPSKLILGGEFDAEFGPIETAVNSKVDKSGAVNLPLTGNTLVYDTFVIQAGTTTDFGTVDGGTY